MHELIPSSLFNTQAHRLADKIEAYRESIGVVFDVDKIESKPSNFHATIKTHLISEIMLVDCETVAQFFYRPTSKIARDGLDHILIQAFLSGKTVVGRSDLECSQQNSSLIVIDSARPWSAYNPSFRNLTLVIPRRLIHTKILDDDTLHGRLLDPKYNPLAALLRSHMLALHQNVAALKYESAYSVMTPTLDLVVATLNYHHSDHARAGTRALSFQIKCFIEENLDDSRLGPERLMQQFNLTRSTLYRLFASTEGGIMNYIRERKLRRAFRRLASARQTGATVAQIAFESGFENESSFSRLFKSYFAVRPSDVRAGVDIFATDTGQAPERLWEAWFRSL